MKTDIDPELTKAYRKGQEYLVDYIEAECEWVKEDVHDGNDGYYKVRSTDLEKARCCDGECNHDDCCGKIPGNCAHAGEITAGYES